MVIPAVEAWLQRGMLVMQPADRRSRRLKKFQLLVTRHSSLSFMCGPHFCRMRITEDVRRYAAEQSLTEEDAIKRGLEEKAAEFAKAGDVYQKV